MSRGGGKNISPGPFEVNEIKDFYGAGIKEGTADIVIAYGPPDEKPTRRFTISIEFAISLPEDGVFHPELGQQLGYSYNIVSENDDVY